MRLIKGWSDYFADDAGTIWSNKFGKWRALKPKKSRGGYLQVGLCRNGEKPKQFLVHRLVAHAFHGLDLDDPKTQVDHINADKTDIRAENLRLCSHKQNADYAHELGLQPKPKRPVKARVIATGEVLEFESACEAARVLSVSEGNLVTCCKGKQPATKGIQFVYAEDDFQPIEKYQQNRPFEPLFAVGLNQIFTTPQELIAAGFNTGDARYVAEGEYKTTRGEVFKFARVTAPAIA